MGARASPASLSAHCYWRRQLPPESMEAGFLPLSGHSLLRPSHVPKTRLAIARKSFRPLQVSLFSSSIAPLSIGCAASPAFKTAHSPPPQSHDAGEASVAEGDASENEMLSVLSGESASIWGQMKEIAKFAGPATGLWICGPLMSLIDTAVIGQSSSLELAALGPGTVVCDSTSYVFMFLSIATSNMVATSLAKKDKNQAQHQISMLLFIAFACGLAMLFVTKFMGTQILTAFTGPENSHIVPAANTYVQIRALAWPAILVGLVAQSASLGMKDSWGPLKALLVASLVNGFGDITLCSFLGYGIAGAAWATMVSQVISAFMMVKTLDMTGFSAFNVSVPSLDELLQIVGIAAPVFVTMIAKVAFYSLLTFFSTSMGTLTLAAHQVMIGVFCTCTVWGEPLSQTAQSFLPELIYGVNRNLMKARILLQSLVIIGALTGLFLGIIGSFIPWYFPYLFTNDHGVVEKMHTVLLPYFLALIATPPTHSLEGTLMAARDFRFLSLSMSGCFTLGGLLLMLLSSRGFGLPGCWWVLAGFQWARLSLGLKRLTSQDGVLYSDKFSQEQISKLKAA